MTTAGERLLHAYGTALARVVAIHAPPADAEAIEQARQAAVDTRDRVAERFQKYEEAREAGRAVLALLDARGNLDNHGHNPWPAHDSACEVCRTLNALRGAIEVLDLDDQKPDLCPPPALDESGREALRRMGYWVPSELATFLRGTLGGAAAASDRRGRLWDAILRYIATVDDGKRLAAARAEVERAAFGEPFDANADDKALVYDLTNKARTEGYQIGKATEIGKASSLVNLAERTLLEHIRGLRAQAADVARAESARTAPGDEPPPRARTTHATPVPYADVVEGRRLTGSIRALETALCRRIAIERGVVDSDAGTINLLADAVHLAREYGDYALRIEQAMTGAHERAQATWRAKIEALERALAEHKKREDVLYAALDRPCPITGEPFFMVIEHPQSGWLPTYGGPIESHGPCERTKPRGDLYRWHFDHDTDTWVEWFPVGLRAIDPDAEVESGDGDDEPAAPAAPPPPEPLTRCRWRSGGCEDIARFVLETTKPYFVDQVTRFPVCASCAEVHDGTHGYPRAVRVDPMSPPEFMPTAAALASATDGKTFGPNEGERGSR